MDRASASCSGTFLKDLIKVASSPSLVRRSLLPSMMVQLIRLTHTLAASKRCRHSTGLLTELEGSWNLFFAYATPQAAKNLSSSNLGFSDSYLFTKSFATSFFTDSGHAVLLIRSAVA